MSTAEAWEGPVGDPARERPGDPAFRDVPVELISPNPDQPRRRFDPEALSGLAESIAEVPG